MRYELTSRLIALIDGFRIGFYATASRLLWIVIRPHDQPPPNPALSGGVRVMVLRWQNMSLGYSDFSMTTHAAINPSVRRGDAGIVVRIKSCALG